MLARVTIYVSAFFLFLFLSLAFIPRVEAASDHLVINSFRVANVSKTTDEFVEIYNPHSSKINIAGWQLAKKTASGSKYNLITSFQSIDILPGESLVIGHKDSTEAPDIFYTSGYSISEDNTIVLFSDDGKTIVDKVGFGKTGDFEGKAMSAAGTDVWSRISGADTDNNLADFKKNQVPGGDFSGLCISEIMPAPIDGDEWIEIYNSEITKDIGGLLISDKLGSIKKFTVPAGTMIEEGQYLVFYKKDTEITLNDDGDGIILTDASGSIIDDTGESYGKVTKGFSYASDGQKWYWTKTPTPKASNIITLESVSNITSKKKSSTAKSGASQKGKLPKTEVLGATAENQDEVFNQKGKPVDPKEQILSYVLIGVAALGGLLYTIYTNREKVIELFIKERKRYSELWEKVWAKLPWG